MMGEENQRCPECGLILYREVSQCPRCFATISPMASMPPTIQRVYETPASEKAPKEKKDVRRTGTIIFVLVVIALIVLTLTYNFLIPRVELNVITAYREGTGLSINVDSKIQNLGTLAITRFSMNITIMNESSGIVAKENYYLADLDAHSSHGFDNINFYGDQFEAYRISIKIDFESEGGQYSDNYEHTVTGSILQRWEDKFMQWGG
jgi:hypothetical protein